MFAISCNTSVVFNLFKWFIFFVFQIIFFWNIFSKLYVKGYFDIWYTYKMRYTWVPSFFQMFCVMQKTRSLFSNLLGFFLFCYEKQIIGVVLLILASILLLLSVLVHSKYKSREHFIFLFWKKSCYFLSRH